MKKIKKLNELINPNDGMSREEIIQDNIRSLEKISASLKKHSEEMENDPMIIEARKEYEIRKANGEFLDDY